MAISAFGLIMLLMIPLAGILAALFLVVALARRRR